MNKNINNFIQMDLIHVNIEASSKKRALEIICESINKYDTNLQVHDIFDLFIQREKLGSTAIGHGVAIPHARMENNDKTIGVFISLKESIDFGAIDNAPVSLLFALLIPHHSTQEHLDILARLAKFFRDDTTRQAALNAQSKETIYNLLSKI
ncbi:MAG: PTS sugar transporter subunit IIA [Pseudomonadota bacterium]